MTDTSASASTSSPTPGPAPELGPEEPTIGQLVAQASRDFSTLLRHEIALLKAELKFSVRMGGMAVGLFLAAAFLVLLAIIMLSVALAYFVSMTGLHLAWSYLIVVLLYLLLAGLLGFVGYRKVRQVGPPEKAIQQAQETKTALLSRGD